MIYSALLRHVIANVFVMIVSLAYVADPSGAKELLDWQPEIMLEKSLQDVWAELSAKYD